MQRLLVGNGNHMHHLPLLGGHLDLVVNSQRPGEARTSHQSSLHSLTRSLDSHHRHRHWLLLSDLFVYSFQGPRETFTVPVPVPLARCTFCRFLLLFCNPLANNILPQGRTKSSSLRLMTKCPLRAGKPSHQHWTGTNPQRHSYAGTRLAEQIR